MPTAYHMSVTLRLLAALLWLGGTSFLAVVGASLPRTLEPGSAGSPNESSSSPLKSTRARSLSGDTNQAGPMRDT